MDHFVKISKDFSTTPGARYRTDGKFSGEEFYDSILEKKFIKAFDESAKLTIDLDGTYGFATSFLSEAFHKLSSKYGADKVWNNIKLISTEEPYLIDEIKEYIFDSQEAG